MVDKGVTVAEGVADTLHNYHKIGSEAGEILKDAGTAVTVINAAVDAATSPDPTLALSKDAIDAFGAEIAGTAGEALGTLGGPMAPVTVPFFGTMGYLLGGNISSVLPDGSNIHPYHPDTNFPGYVPVGDDLWMFDESTFWGVH